MENKDQGVGTTPAGNTPPIDGVYAVTPIPSTADAGASVVQPVGEVVKEENAPHTIPESPQKKRLKKLFITAGIVVAVVLLLGGIAFLIDYLRSDQQAVQQNAGDLFDNTQIPLEDLVAQDGVNVLGARTLVINGSLRANDGFVVTPSDAPDAPTAGQIYYDEDSNELGY
ncbi:MAG TPA: hypothetical protein VFT58_05235, partial [Nitrososphaera sp.]|nr:hypothetical protein [Nitrososphaera sp.]